MTTAFIPTSTSSPTTLPDRTGRRCARDLPVVSGAMTKTWSPPGPLRSALTGTARALPGAPAALEVGDNVLVVEVRKGIASVTGLDPELN